MFGFILLGIVVYLACGAMICYQIAKVFDELDDVRDIYQRWNSRFNIFGKIVTLSVFVLFAPLTIIYSIVGICVFAIQKVLVFVWNKMQK